MQTKTRDFASASFFFAANLITGVLNYLFQVYASKELSAAEYGHLNAWFSDLMMLFFLGGVAQYCGIFFPAPRNSLKKAVVAINGLSFSLAALWIFSPPGETVERGVLVLTVATAFFWLIGQIQFRKMFVAIGVANFTTSLSKLGLVLLPLFTLVTVERFRIAFFANYFPALWLMSVVAWRLPNTATIVPQKKNDLRLWMAPVVMSLATAIIPQMDMVLLSRLWSELEFQDFARASLFSRAIFFLFLILAQWMLPFQIQGEFTSFKHRFLNPALAGICLLVSGSITYLSPWAIDFFLHWDRAPSLSLVFLSCLNMSVLTWIFLLVQKCCAQGQSKKASYAIIGLVVEAAAQFLSRWPGHGYFVCALIFQTTLIWYLSREKTA